jgi:DNA-binding transcriptional ArsR family regulator
VPRRRHFISMNIEMASRQLEALGNRTRLGIYRTLVRAGSNGLPVGRLQERMNIALSTLSHHLRRLVDTGLVTQERQGTMLICRAHYPTMNALIGYLVDECCAEGERHSEPEAEAMAS